MPNFCQNLCKKIFAIVALSFQIIITIIYASNLDRVLIWQNILTPVLLILDILYSASLDDNFNNTGNNPAINENENVSENINNIHRDEDQAGLMRTHQPNERENRYRARTYNNISKNFKKK